MTTIVRAPARVIADARDVVQTEPDTLPLPFPAPTPLVALTVHAVATAADALARGDVVMPLALVIAASCPQQDDLSDADAGRLLELAVDAAQRSPAEGDCRRLPDGRLAVLRQLFPDGAWGADIVSAPDALVAESWVEIEAHDAAVAPLVQ
jgi:hypothetical protein